MPIIGGFRAYFPQMMSPISF